MSDFLNIAGFLAPINISELNFDRGYKEGTIGFNIKVHDEENFPDMDEADLVFIGCGEQRGNGHHLAYSAGPDAIRRQFYQLFFWHQDLRIADLGNLRKGAGLADTYAALRTVVNELISEKKTVIILGGSHDLTLAQYYAYEQNKSIIEVTNVDALIDLNLDSDFRCDNFLMELLTGEPNYVRHYNHIAFQSYFVHPRMLETMDKLRFDCFRVGNVKEHIEDMEPVLRNCHLLSFDIAAIANAFAPANNFSPNGLTGEEACTLMQFAGMGRHMRSIGIYGYQPEKDKENLTAKQISQMLWYLMDGRSRAGKEAMIDERDSFNEYHTAFAEVDTIFLQSKKQGRWWRHLPNKQFIACSYKDYLLASSNEIPERWLRAQERL